MTWTCTVLAGPKGKPMCQALGFASGIVVGTTTGSNRPAAIWWPGGAAEPIAVEGLKDFTVRGAGGHQIAGLVSRRTTTEAVVLEVTGSSLSATRLHERSFESTRLHGCGDGRQVGSGQRKGSRRPYALAWTGTAESVRMLEPPGPDAAASARAVAGDVIVGDWEDERPMRACMWRGETPIDLHPDDSTLHSSECIATSGDTQVGRAFTRKNGQRALLWRGSATSCVDLTPPDAAGAVAYACAPRLQVGCRWLDAEQPSAMQAMLWRGAAGDAVDLHALVPAPYNTSTAWAVLVDGDRIRIAGSAMHYVDGVNKGERAVLWEGRLT